MGQINPERALRGRMAPGDASASEVHGTGRVCDEPTCDTVLSMYNATGSCWQHEEPHAYVLQAPRKRRRDARVA